MVKIKRVTLFFTAILFTMAIFFSISAIAKDINDLKSFAKVANNGSEIGFTFTAVDKDGKLLYESEGITLVYNEMFSVNIPDEFLIIDNKVNRWLYKINDEEIIVTDASVEDASIADNPFAFLRGETLDKIKNYDIEVVGRAGNVPPTLQSVPSKIVLISALGIKYTIEILSFKESTQLSDSNFVLDPAKYPNAIVVEM